MKTFVKIFIATGIVALMSSCSMTYPMSASSAPMGNKVGVSKTTVLFASPYLKAFAAPKMGVLQGWHLNKSCGIVDAARNGGITGPISVVDVTIKNYILWKRKIITVYGN